MGFLSGRVTALRFKARGARPHLFDLEHIDRLADHAAGRQKLATADGVETGWTAGASILDTSFSLEKNVVNDALCFELRVDTNRPPADLLRAYAQVELEALAKNNPSGFASARQKREAKQTARDRIEQEAKDGRFLKRKCVPVLWDRTTNEVLFGATSYTHADRFAQLFEQTFGANLTAPDSTTDGLFCVTADARAQLAMGQFGAYSWRNRTLSPAEFVPGAGSDVAWIAGADNCDYLGNEFLLWLWFYTDTESDTVTAEDGSEITLMLARSLVMECPRGQTGADGFRTEGPARLPEARRAAQAGKLPRKAGLTLVRHDAQYEFTLHAESLAVGSAKLPAPDEGADSRARLEHRVTATRDLLEALDLLYAHFVRLRLSPRWPNELAEMRAWLAGGARAGDGLGAVRKAMRDFGAKHGVTVSVSAKPAA